MCYDRVIYPEHILIHPVEIITEEKGLNEVETWLLKRCKKYIDLVLVFFSQNVPG